MSLKGVRSALCTLENEWNSADSAAYCTLIIEDITLIDPTLAHAILKIHIRQESAGVSTRTTLRCVVALAPQYPPQHSPQTEDEWQVLAFYLLSG